MIASKMEKKLTSKKPYTAYFVKGERGRYHLWRKKREENSLTQVDKIKTFKTKATARQYLSVLLNPKPKKEKDGKEK